MQPTINLTKRVRRRKLKSGAIVKQLRYVVIYREPQTGKRHQEFFELQKAAQKRRAELTVIFTEGSYIHKADVPTVGEVIDHWLQDKAPKVKPNTFTGYRIVVAHIRTVLGVIKLTDLATAQIRSWHRDLAQSSGDYTARRAMSHLKSILSLAEEDYGVRAPSMPTGLQRARQRPRKAILTPDQIALIIEAALNDPERGVYYAFPFLAGTRPSEQLGLLWNDVDFEENIIRIRRIQERNGSLTEMTKTEAGTRDIPMGRVLRGMLMQWKIRSPKAQTVHRVFPGPGRVVAWPERRRRGGGGPLLYQNWRRRYWVPVFKKLGLPYVTPHSARHSFISVLQAQGVEVGLVAKLAGHANATVTLGHYTQAVRGGETAINALEEAYAT